MRNERAPRTLAETSFSTGYPRATITAKETGRYILFVLWLLLAVAGGTLVARHWNAIVALVGG